jgi:hypothetical protein
MRNMLLEKVEPRVEETRLGVRRRYVEPDGRRFEEFVSHPRKLLP